MGYATLADSLYAQNIAFQRNAVELRAKKQATFFNSMC